ncbi:UNVERIFIED_CONTAM: Retrovirus-related Pol polyprotein from transposon TNT 1-94 [Sesamum latifolium]|uniref:Retrovirus-related Pol polyprotein from transposon TNT 1-94 n=1 Tax=Sesamum latifolium TaxID=2727402 RepID=A0AAW2XJA9_9LAMI
MTELESRDVDFLEEDFPSISEVTVKGETPYYYPVIDGDNESDPRLSGSCSLEELNSQTLQMQRIKRGGIPRSRYEIEGESFMCASVDIDEPATYEEAVTSPNANEWITAMKDEMSSMAKNNVWELVDLLAGHKTIRNKWVLNVKRKADGSMNKFKARVVVKGYTQREGIDYEETFSPVVRFASVRLILAIVAHLDLELFQMDVKTAFLNGEQDEEIYMDQPKGFQGMGQKRKVEIKRILRYLKGTSDLALCYHGGSLRLVGYSDADGSADKDERKSTSGYAFLLRGVAITWCTKKQPCISLSTMEAEYVACTSVVQVDIWLRKFLKSLRILAHIDNAVVIYCDNTTTIAYANDPKYHGRTKHIDTR